MYNIQLKWLTITCFELHFGHTAVVSDPCIGENSGNDLTWQDIEACDILTLTHCHWDHITDLPRLMEKFPAPLLAPAQSAYPLLRWLDCNPSRIYPMESNLELDFGEVRVRALFGTHTTPQYQSVTELETAFLRHPCLRGDRAMFEMQALGSMEYRNYLYTTADGVRLLLWGNDVSTVQKNLVNSLHPDICILQLTAQDPLDVARLAADAGARVLIPHHMDLFKTREEYLPQVERCREEFLRLVPDGQFIEPRNNQWIEL